METGAGFDCDVVIPTHGRNPELLAETIRSVAGQTLAPVRILVVVDGNPPAAREIRARHSEVEVIAQPHQGVAAARQKGVDAATSRWIAFVDDDDLWLPEKQAVTARYLHAHPDCLAVRAGYWMFTAPDSPIDGLNGQTVELRASTLDDLLGALPDAVPLNDLSYLDIAGDSLGLMLEFNRGVIGTSVIARELAQALDPVPAGQQPGDDFLLFCNVAASTEWQLIPQRLLGYRVHPGQDTSRSDAEGPRQILLAKRHAWATLGERAPRSLASYGRFYRAEVRQFVWSQARRGRIGAAFSLYADGLPLLPRWRDRALAAVPEPVAWRVGQVRQRLHPARTGRPPW